MTEEELMLTAVLNCRRVDLYADKVSLSSPQKNRLSEMQDRRKNGEPLQYIIGSCEFMGLPFLVDKRVFIPRPETEVLVEAVIRKAKERKEGSLKILDIGTGSGNVAVSIAKNIPGALVSSVDISLDALCLAAENARRNGVEKNIHFLQSDLFSYFDKDLNSSKGFIPAFLRPSGFRMSPRERIFGNSPRAQLFDIIVSNPPYVPTGVVEVLPQEVKEEPRLALDGGDDGLDFYRRLVKDVHRFLKSGGLFLFEIGAGQKKAAEEILSQNHNLKIAACINDYNQKERVIITERI